MNRLRILMDGNTISESPDGWEDITSSIKRVKELNSIFITTDAELTFRHDGRDYLMTKYDDGFCNSVEVELQEYCGAVYETFFKGIIFISSAEVDRKQCTIKVKIEDNSFYAKINNNKGLEVFPFAEQTKNSASDPTNPQYALTACAYEKVQLFNPADGVYAGVLVNPPYTGAMYPVYNLFEYLIAFMSDNTIEFDSTLFGAGGDYEGLTVTCGIVLRQYLMGGTTESDFKDNFQKISFSQLFTEVNKKINIGMFVDYSGVLPKIRIERRSYLQDSAISFSALNIDELKESVDVDQLYGSVRLGSTTVSDKANTSTQHVSFPEDISFFGFKEEQFVMVTNCNIDKELDLVSSFIISSDIIEDCFWNGETTYDDQLFMIMCDVSGGVYSAQKGVLGTTTNPLPVFYNLALNGESVSNNYIGSVPFSIAQYIGNTDDLFHATKTNFVSFPTAIPLDSPQTFGSAHIRFEDDYTGVNFDINNRYGNGTPAGTPVSTINSRYDTIGGGIYGFSTLIKSSLNIITPTYKFISGNSIYYNHFDFIQFRNIGGTTIFGTGIVFLTVVGANYWVYIYAQTGLSPVAGWEIWRGGVYIDDVSAAGGNLPEAVSITDYGTIDIYINRFDSFGILMDSQISTSNVSVGQNNSSFTVQINMVAGDYATVSCVITNPAFVWNSGGGILKNSTFSCPFTFNGGGVYGEYDSDSYCAYNHKWEYPLTKDDFNTIATNQTQQLEFARSGEHRYNGWIDSVKFKRFKEEKAQFITYTSKNNLH